MPRRPSAHREARHQLLDGQCQSQVIKVHSPGHLKPSLTFPGMNLLSDEKRRAVERQAPPEGQENQYLINPALMLNILPIYREGLSAADTLPPIVFSRLKAVSSYTLRPRRQTDRITRIRPKTDGSYRFSRCQAGTYPKQARVAGRAISREATQNPNPMGSTHGRPRDTRGGKGRVFG